VVEQLTFIHAADVHLGRAFSGLERTSPDLGGLFRGAHYDAFNRIVRTAVDRKVDFITLGGDVFDASNPNVRARVVFRDGIARLYDSGIPVFMVLGNHDPLATFPEGLKNLPGLHLFGPTAEGIALDPVKHTDGVMIYGTSFPRSAVSENLVNRFQRDSGVDLAIGLVHANVSGIGGHHDYAPCTVDDLRSSGMDVWCLGHVHVPMILSRSPLIVYPGTCQGAQAKEAGERGCQLVTVRKDGEPETEFIPVAPVRWAILDVDVTDCRSIEDVPDAVEMECSKLSEPDEWLRAVVVRINLTGSGTQEISEALARDEELSIILSERLAALSVPVFPETIRDVSLPWIDPDMLMDEEGFLGDFLKLCGGKLDEPTALRQMVAEVQSEFLRLVSPAYMRSGLMPHNIEESEEWAGYLRKAKETVTKMFADPKGGSLSR
jgi:exonuclease SbcD